MGTEVAFDPSAGETNTKLRQTHKCRHCLPLAGWLAGSVLTSSSSAENVSHQGGAINNQVSELHQL